MAGVSEIHTDSDYLLAAKHNSAAAGGLILINKNAHFKSCGVTVGVAIYNDTDGSNGLVTVVTEDRVTCTLAGGTNNFWTQDDQAYIYKTATKDGYISKITTDRSAGRKVTRPSQLDDDGFLPDDADIDREERETFGPGQPERVR
jgi:hypothetical protein